MHIKNFLAAEEPSGSRKAAGGLGSSLFKADTSGTGPREHRHLTRLSCMALRGSGVGNAAGANARFQAPGAQGVTENWSSMAGREHRPKGMSASLKGQTPPTSKLSDHDSKVPGSNRKDVIAQEDPKASFARAQSGSEMIFHASLGNMQHVLEQPSWATGLGNAVDLYITASVCSNIGHGCSLSASKGGCHSRHTGCFPESLSRENCKRDNQTRVTRKQPQLTGPG